MNMKKMYRRLFLLLLCVVYLLTACHTSTGSMLGENESKELEDENTKGELDDENSKSEPDETVPVGDFEYNPSSVVQAMAITEKGYYYIANSTMYFYELANDISIPMCSRTNCRHDSGECDAYANGLIIESHSYICAAYELFYYNNKLYMVERDENTFLLCRYDSNFNNKEIIAELSRYEKDQMLTADQEGAFTIFDGYFYYYTYLWDEDAYQSRKGYVSELNCMRVQLKKGATPEKVGSFEYASDHKGYAVLTDGKNIYYMAGHYKRDWTTENPMEYVIARYSVSENAFVILDSYKGERTPDAWGDDFGLIVCDNQSVCMAENGTAYIISDNNIVAINYKTGERKKIYATPYDFNKSGVPEWELRHLAFDGTYLYFVEHEVYKAVYLTAIDTQGNLIRRYELECLDEYIDKYSKHKGYIVPTYSIDLLGVADGNILVASDVNAYKNLSGETTDKVGVYYGVGMIDTSDFLENKDIEIKQIYRYQE